MLRVQLILAIFAFSACGKKDVSKNSSDQNAKSIDSACEANATTTKCNSVTVWLKKGVMLTEATEDLSIKFSSNSDSGKFYTDERCTEVSDKATLKKGKDSVWIFYKGDAGEQKITASSKNLTDASCQMVIK